MLLLPVLICFPKALRSLERDCLAERIVEFAVLRDLPPSVLFSMDCLVYAAELDLELNIVVFMGMFK